MEFFAHANEASKANFHENKRIIYRLPFMKRSINSHYGYVYTYPGYQRFFSRATRSFVGRRHERRSREKKPLAQSALIYRARRTLTLSLICQSNRRFFYGDHMHKHMKCFSVTLKTRNRKPRMKSLWHPG